MLAAEADDQAARTFNDNFRRLQPESPPIVLGGGAGDLEQLDLANVAMNRSPDILVGGPPCQGFSRLGRAKLRKLRAQSEKYPAEDPRNDLYRRFLAAAELWRPRAVVMENVPGMMSIDGRDAAETAASELAAVGYRVGFGILNAVWYGVPQYRERLFFVGIRDDLSVAPALPPATHRAVLPTGYLRPAPAATLPLSFVRHYELPVDTRAATTAAVTVSEALDDLPPITEHLSGGHAARGDFRRLTRYCSPAHSHFARLMRVWPGLPACDGVFDHVIRRTPRDYETFRRMKPGDRYPEALAIARRRRDEDRELLRARGVVLVPGTSEYEKHEKRFVPPYPEHMFLEKWRKLIPEQPSWTVPAHLSKDVYSHIHHGDQARAISIREAARLQSFPDAFLFCGNMGDCYRQIGNAVPPLVGWAIAAAVLRSIGAAGMVP